MTNERVTSLSIENRKSKSYLLATFNLKSILQGRDSLFIRTRLSFKAISQSHYLSSSIVSWDEDPLERSSDAFRAGGGPAEKVEFSWGSCCC